MEDVDGNPVAVASSEFYVGSDGQLLQRRSADAEARGLQAGSSNAITTKTSTPTASALLKGGRRLTGEDGSGFYEYTFTVSCDEALTIADSTANNGAVTTTATAYLGPLTVGVFTLTVTSITYPESGGMRLVARGHTPWSGGIADAVGWVDVEDCCSAEPRDEACIPTGTVNAPAATAFGRRLSHLNCGVDCSEFKDDDNDGSNGCFPADAEVRMADGATKAMHELVRGDMLQTSLDYQAITPDRHIWESHFGERQRTVLARFLAVHHTAGDKPLHLTGNHFIFAQSGSIGGAPVTESVDETRMVPARELVVGDFILARDRRDAGKLAWSQVIAVEEVVLPGVYAPVTWSFRLIVDDVLVSSGSLFTPGMAKAYDRFPDLPWEQLFVVINTPLNVYFRWNLDDIFSVPCPKWLCDKDPHANTVSPWLGLLRDWADVVLTSPIAYFLETVGLVHTSLIAYLFLVASISFHSDSTCA